MQPVDWLKAPQPTDCKKEALETELREVKRPVSNTNNILSEGRVTGV